MILAILLAAIAMVSNLGLGVKSDWDTYLGHAQVATDTPTPRGTATPAAANGTLTAVPTGPIGPPRPHGYQTVVTPDPAVPTPVPQIPTWFPSATP